MEKSYVSYSIFDEGGKYQIHRLRLDVCYNGHNLTPNQSIPVLIVERWIDGVWSRIPSGWYYNQVCFYGELCIDEGQRWYVHPSKKCWEEIYDIIISLYKN